MTLPKNQSVQENSARGIALLIAVIFTAVMLAIGTALSSLGYKQVILSTVADASQQSFYAADTAMECVLAYIHSDVQGSPLPTGSANTFSCVGNSYHLSSSGSSGSWYVYTVKGGSGTSILLGSSACARATVYWPQAGSTVRAYVYTAGYNNPICTVNTHTTTRGLKTSF